MKKSNLIFGSILLFSSLSFSQDIVPVFEDTVNESSVLRITSLNHYSSNRFNNAFTDKFIFGGYIDEDLKNNQHDRLKGVNVFGGEAEQRIDSYTPSIQMFGKEKYGLMLSFSDNHLFSGNVSRDFFRLAMYGNANYVGDTLDLSYSHFLYQHYQKFSVGFYDKKSMSSIQISYVSGSKGLDFFVGNSFLWSHEENDSVEIQLNGTAYQTENLNPYWAFQGNGIALDINYNFIFDSKKGDQQIINFRIANVGGIFWNKNSRNYSIDSTLHFTGFNVNDILSRDSLNGVYNFEDTLGIIEKTERQIDALPVEISIHKTANRNGKKLQPIFGFKAILTPEFRPYFYGGIFYQPTKYFDLTTHLSYGGFSNLRLGLMMSYRNEKINIGIGTVDVIGNISKNFGYGRSALLSAQFKL